MSKTLVSQVKCTVQLKSMQIFLKKFDVILNNKNESFTKQSESIVEVWHRLTLCKFEKSDLDYAIQIMDWAKLNTLNIVLAGEWKKFKGQYQDALLKEIKSTQNQLKKLHSMFDTRCQKLLVVINNPWSDPTLEYLVRTPNAEIGPKEIEFFCVETAYLIAVRLKKLCESQCEDLALNLVKAFMKCYRQQQVDNFNLNATETQVWFIFDMHVALLYKFKENDSLLEMLKGVSAEEGLNIITRFANKRVEISKIWKHCHRIAILASKVYISSTILKPIDEIQAILKELLRAYVLLNNSEEFLKDVVESIRSIIRLAETAAHIYIFCDVFQEQFETKMKSFIIELYIRALTTDMNLLERQKSDNEKEKLAETTRRLADGFTNLGEVLRGDVNVSRECVLTAFSLQPTNERLKKIEELAKVSGLEVLDTGQEWKCKLHPPVLPTDDLAWICSSCGEYMCKPQLNVPLNTNIALNECLTEEKLGITRELCDDLVVLLSSPRYQVFSWLLDWPDLQRLCVMYLNDPERTKNLVTELKFLDIDYSIFANIKKEPLDEYAGIERGYEHYLDHEFNSDDDPINYASEDTASQESRFYSLSSDSASEMLYLPSAPKKSDPNTLKSLRLFRPSLKRSRNNVETNVPEKVLKSEPVDFAVPSSSKQMELPFPMVYSTKPSNNTSLAIDSSTKQNQYFVPVQACTKSSLNSFSPVEVKSSADAPVMKLIYSSQNITQPIKTYANQFNHNNHLDSTYYKAYPGKSATITNKTATQVNSDNSYVPSVGVPKNGQVATLQQVGGQVAIQKSPTNKPMDLSSIHGSPNTSSNSEFPPNKTRDSTSSPTQESIILCQKQPVHAAVKFLDSSSDVSTMKAAVEDTVCHNTYDTDSIRNGQGIEDEILNYPKSDIVELPKNKLPILTSPTNNDQKTETDIPSSIKSDCDLHSGSDTDDKIESRVPNLFEDLKPMQYLEPASLKHLHTKIVEIKENKHEMANLKSYGKKKKLQENNIETTEGTKCTVVPFSCEKDDGKSNISLEDSTAEYADTLISAESEYDCFSETNPIVQNVLSKIDSFEKEVVPSVCNLEEISIPAQDNNVGSPDQTNKNKPLIAKEIKCLKTEKETECTKKSGKSHLRKVPKYESYPDTGSDSQFELDSDDQYNRCYIELFKNNLLYDTIEGVCKNIDYYLKKSNNNNTLSDLSLKRGKKFKKGGPLKKSRKSKTGNISDKTVLDVDSNSKPKSDVPVRDIRIILNRLPEFLCSSLTYKHIDTDNCGSEMSNDLAKNDSSPRKEEQPNSLSDADKENSSSSNSSLVSSTELNGLRDARNIYKSACDIPDINSAEGKLSKRDNFHIDQCDDNINCYGNSRNVQNASFRDYTRTPCNKNDDILNGNFSHLNKDKNIESEEHNKDSVLGANPQVVLDHLSVTNSNYVRSVLANIPGLHDTELIRPTNTNLVVNVVQIAGGRSSASVPVANAQTSTQVTPHIQRIGQPRFEKPQNDQPDNTNPIVTSVTTSVSSSVKPSTSQPSTLINILSQQVIRPGQSNYVRTRPSPLINIVSHQIIRPSTQIVPKMITSSAQTNEQVNDAPKTEASSEQPTSTTVTSAVKNLAATVKTTAGVASSPAPGTILQFICKSATLPKFQQAFGKTVYHTNNVETTDATSSGENSNSSSDTNKKVPVKSPTVNIQPLQGSVIYTRQVPVGQAINLIPPGRQVFRIATSNPEQISLVKDSVIHSKMSALLTAALQGKKTAEVQVEGDGNDSVERVTVTRPTLVQSARIVKPVIQIPSNVIRTSTNTQSNLSSTTLEQLREFDMVYKQIKERSNTGTTPSESSTQSESDTSPHGISVTYLNQGQKFTQLSPVVVVSSYCNLQPAASPALSVTSQGSSSPCVTPAPTPTLPKVASKTSSKGKSLKNTSTHISKSSPIPKPQQKPQEDEHTTQRIFDILAEYAEQLRNSPDLNNKPAPRRRSNPPTNPNHNSKRKKSSSSKKPSTTGSVISESDLEDQRTMGSEDSSCGVVQLSVKDEEQGQSQTTESNDSTTSTRPLILTETNSNSTTRNLIIADSSVGEALKLQNTAVLVPGNYIMPVSMVKGGQQIAVVSGGSKILATVPARSGPNMLLFQSFLNQNRKPGLPTVKYSTLQPISGISSQNLAGVSGQSSVILPQTTHSLTAVTLGQPLTLKKMEDSDNGVNTELLLAIAQPRESANATENSPRPDSSSSIHNSNSIKLDDNKIHMNNTSEKIYTYQKSAITAPIATPVISQNVQMENGSEQNSTSAQPSIITLNIAAENNKDGASRTAKRVQSVLVTACTSNGPMLSHTPPRYRKASESTTINSEVNLKGAYLHNGEKQKDEPKHFQTTAVYFPTKTKKSASNPAKLDRELHQLCLQRKQAALERELRLQKSLSEECEDLGVDEPSTSDLFPEADLLFDSNHSPSFDQTSQEGRKAVHPDKDKSITLFSDDDNSSSLRTEFLFDSVQFQTEGELQYEQSRQLTNGQSSTSNESGSSCEDNTLLQNCASMSDVTLNSPISPEFTDNPTHMNKYKFKYSNRKKAERHKQVETWTTGGEVSSSEDTMCSELGKIVHSPKGCVIKRGSHSSSCDEDEEFKVVRIAISKTDLAKDDESCEELHYDDDLDSPSGRGARRSVKKMCSCCNGAQEGNRKRPSSRPHTPALHKKAFLNKKR